MKEADDMNRKREIIKLIRRISGKYSEYEVFTDWIRCGALTVSNSVTFFHGKVWQDREQMFLDTMKKYAPEEQKMLAEMMGLLTLALEEEATDVLGQIYMEAGMGSKAAGQFFTPFHLSRVCAELTLSEENEDGLYIVNEPSCGGGGMIIAAAAALKDKGINFQKKMRVVAQDLDWKGVYMCYLQLSLLGINAVCIQGNTLTEPYVKGKTDPARILYTPAYMGVLL